MGQGRAIYCKATSAQSRRTPPLSVDPGCNFSQLKIIRKAVGELLLLGKSLVCKELLTRFETDWE
jgi:hypothetical protein